MDLVQLLFQIYYIYRNHYKNRALKHDNYHFNIIRHILEKIKTALKIVIIIIKNAKCHIHISISPICANKE